MGKSVKVKTSDIIDAKDFKIKNLERMIAEKDKEIGRLEKIIEASRYFTEIALSDVKMKIEKWKNITKASLDGDMQKPVLTLASDQDQSAGIV